MPLVTSTEMFKKAYEGHYAVGAFNVNNMEIIQGIVAAAQQEKSPLILQVSAGARKYANHIYLMKLVEAAIEDTGLPICLHLDHGEDFDICKACVDGGFTSVMIDGSKHPFEENIEMTRRVVEYAHERGVVVEAELGRLAGVEDAVKVNTKDATYTDPDQAVEFVERTGCDSLQSLSAPVTALTNSKANRNWTSHVWKKSPTCCLVILWFCTVLPPLSRPLLKNATSTAASWTALKAYLKTCCCKQENSVFAKSTSIPTCAWQ